MIESLCKMGVHKWKHPCPVLTEIRIRQCTRCGKKQRRAKIGKDIYVWVDMN